MKKLFIVIISILVSMALLVGCKEPAYEVSIKTNIKSYAVSSSMVQGIIMSPELNPTNKSSKIQYYWATTAGSFIGFKEKEVVNTGESLIWSAISVDSLAAPLTTTITLIAKEKKTGKVLASANLIIEGSGFVYTIKKQTPN